MMADDLTPNYEDRPYPAAEPAIAFSVWPQLAAVIPPALIAWRQDGKPMNRDGRFFARFVCYIEAGTVRERLDAVAPGQWDLALELLPGGHDHNQEEMTAFKARLRVFGVSREDVGLGKDYKAAATDAFKRAAVRFGIGHELYDMEQLWCEVDGDGKYAKPVEDPGTVYARKHGVGAPVARPVARTRPPTVQERTAAAVAEFEGDGQAPTGAPADAPADAAAGAVSCPKCDGAMWDNRLTKRNPKAPDYKCKDRNCDGVIWPPKPGEATQLDALAGKGAANGRTATPRSARPGDEPPHPADAGDFPSALQDEDDDLPF